MSNNFADKNMAKVNETGWLVSVKPTVDNDNYVEVSINGLDGEVIKYDILRSKEQREQISQKQSS